MVGVMQAADAPRTAAAGCATSACCRPPAAVASPESCSTRRSRFHARGYAWAGLGVDVQNETGAYRLYESVGMRMLYKADAWQLTVPAARSLRDPAGVGGRE